MDEINLTPSYSQKRSSGLIVKIIIIIVILGVVGTGIALGSRIWDPVWNPFRPSPEKVIERMLTNMNDIKALHFESRIEIETKEDTKAFKISMNFAGDLDTTDSQNPKSTGDFDLAIIYEGMQISLIVNTKSIGEISYFKINQIPLPLQLPLAFFGIDANQIENQWIKIDKKALEKLGGGEAYLKEGEISKEQQEAMIEKVRKLFEERKFYYIKEELPDEKINGKKTYHYLLSLDKEGIKEIIPELIKIMGEISPGGAVPMPAEEEISKGINEFFEKVGEITADIWIGKKDNFLYKVKGEKEIDILGEFKDKNKLDGKAGRIISIIKIDFDFSDFNQPVEIKPPEDFKSLEEIIPIKGLPIGLQGIPTES